MNYANDTTVKAAGISQSDTPSPVAVAISDLVDTQSTTASLLERLQRALTPVLSEPKAPPPTEGVSDQEVPASPLLVDLTNRISDARKINEFIQSLLWRLTI